MKARFPAALFFAFAVCALLFFSSAKNKEQGDGRWTYKIEATKVLSAEERNKVWEIYTIRLTDLGIKKSDVDIAWSGNTINVAISNPGKYGAVKEQVTQLLAAEGRLSFWETYRWPEIIRFLNPPLHNARSRHYFFAMFDSTSFKSSTTGSENCLLGYVFDHQKNNLMRITDSLCAAKALPADVRFAFLNKPNEEHPGTTGVILLKSKTDGTARLDNPRLTEVKTITNKYSMHPEISMRMDSIAAVKWAIMTKENTGRSIAVVMDGAVLLYPNVNGEITGGVSSITGNFTKAEADRIVSLLKTGPLPCPVKMAEINNGK